MAAAEGPFVEWYIARVTRCCDGKEGVEVGGDS